MGWFAIPAHVLALFLLMKLFLHMRSAGYNKALGRSASETSPPLRASASPRTNGASRLGRRQGIINVGGEERGAAQGTLNLSKTSKLQFLGAEFACLRVSPFPCIQSLEEGGRRGCKSWPTVESEK